MLLLVWLCLVRVEQVIFVQIPNGPKTNKQQLTKKHNNKTTHKQTNNDNNNDNNNKQQTAKTANNKQ